MKIKLICLKIDNNELKTTNKDEWLKFIKINCRRLWNIRLINCINLSWKKGEKSKNENFYIWKCSKL